MPYPWTGDDLLFALVRAAHLEPSQSVADGLLSAADRPDDGLAGVSPLQARIRAAQVLVAAGNRDDAIAVARDAVRAASPDTDGSARMQAAGVLVEAGAADEAAALAIAAARAHPHPGSATLYLRYLSRWLEAEGHLPQAIRLADEAVADASRMPGSDGKYHSNPSVRELNKRAGQLKAAVVSGAEKTREDVLDAVLRAAADGTDLGEAAARGRREALRAAAADIAGQQPWPSLVDDRLVWWPSAEYDRLVRQVPHLSGILGSTWREHTARVESFMSAAVPADGEARLLAHADFAGFTTYLEKAGADPRLSTVQTAFTRHAGAGYHYPARWPPGRRYPCWCGSHRKYPRCCGSHPATH